MLTTNRLIFNTVDSSYSQPQPSAIVGFTVIKAPKGLTKAQFINKGDINTALQLFGTPSSTYPDIQNVLDFIQNYGLWVSAPGGSASTADTYFGGAYVTTLGSMEPIYQVTEDVDGTPVFDKKILVTAHNPSPFSSGMTAPVFTGGGAHTLIINEIDPAYFNTGVTGNIYIIYPRSDGSLCSIQAVISGTDIKTVNPALPLTAAITIGSITSATVNTAFKKVTLVGSTETYTYTDPVTGTVYSNDINFTSQELYLSGLSTGAIKFTYVLDITGQAIMAVYQNSPRSTAGSLTLNNLNVKTPGTPSYNTATFSYSEASYSGKTYVKNFTVSTDINKVDGFNSNLYAENVLGAGMNNFIACKVFDGRQFTDSPSNTAWPGSTSTTPTITPSPINVSLVGQRGVTATGYQEIWTPSVLTAGWDSALDSQYLEVGVYFDSNGDSTIATKLNAMRASFNKTATYIMPIKVPNAPSTGNADVATTAIKDARASRPNNTGVGYYCNELFFKEGYSGTSFWITPMGAIGSMLALIMEHKLGGVAPMFTNEGNPSLGGQITFSASRQKYNFSANNLDTLDAAGVNPIIRDINYGIMLMSQKTGQSPAVLSDWSYLGHSMSFDLFYREIEKGVMFPQLGKPIDDTHMTIRREQTQNLLSKRISGSTKIWDSASVLVEEVNTPETKAQNNFILKVRVKVTPFSEYVTLEFENVAQTATV